MKLIVISSAAIILCLATRELRAQVVSWQWTAQERVLNPSGLAVTSRAAQFNVLDWNGDGWWDFVINDSNALQLYLASTSEEHWEKHEITFPILGEGFILPAAFEFVDFDFDGDFDLAADGRGFWWNSGSNQSPVWVQDDSVLAGLSISFNLSFVDYDRDGNWDVTGDLGEYTSAQFFRNTTGGRYSHWASDSSKVPGLGKELVSRPLYRDLDADGDLDAFGVAPAFVDPGACNRLLWYQNLGTLAAPTWKELWLSYFWCGYYSSNAIPSYQAVDFDRDGDVDLITRDWQRRFAFIKNLGSADSLRLDLDAPEVMGPITTESNAIPVLFDHMNDGSWDLIVSEDFEYDFIFKIYHEGRVLSFANEGGRFDVGSPRNAWFKNPYPLSIYNFANHFHFNFSDFDRDGDSDYLFSYYKVSAQDTVTGSRVIYFRNNGSQAQPNWIADSLLFAPFDLSPQRFWAPQLIDVDKDGDDDMFIKRGTQFVFYENLASGATLQWREQTSFMNGLNQRPHYLATFADLTRDGLAALVFGNEDGTLELYANVGTAQAPAWQLVPEAFAGLDFGENAALAFGDMDHDGRLDLFVGNRNGQVFFYRNESTVRVAEPEIEAPHVYALYQSHPNPSHSETRVGFIVPPRESKQRVLIKIYDLLGRLVAVLFDREVAPGRYEVVWNGKDLNGTDLPSGTYLYRLEAGDVTIAKRMTLLR